MLSLPSKADTATYHPYIVDTRLYACMMEHRPAAATFERISVLLGIAVKMHSQKVHFTVLKSQ